MSRIVWDAVEDFKKRGIPVKIVACLWHLGDKKMAAQPVREVQPAKIELADGSIVSNNEVRNNGSWGIRVEAGGFNTSNLITGNTVLNNTDGQILDNGINTLPNGEVGTNNLAIDDLNIIA